MRLAPICLDPASGWLKVIRAPKTNWLRCDRVRLMFGKRDPGCFSGVFDGAEKGVRARGRMGFVSECWRGAKRNVTSVTTDRHGTTCSVGERRAGAQSGSWNGRTAARGWVRRGGHEKAPKQALLVRSHGRESGAERNNLIQMRLRDPFSPDWYGLCIARPYRFRVSLRRGRHRVTRVPHEHEHAHGTGTREGEVVQP
jgi:hypothetical protein